MGWERKVVVVVGRREGDVGGRGAGEVVVFIVVVFAVVGVGGGAG
jgi:hypothetical protein